MPEHGEGTGINDSDAPLDVAQRHKESEEVLITRSVREIRSVPSTVPGRLDLPSAQSRRKLLRLTSTALLIWSLVYAVPHLYWGLGGQRGLSMLKAAAPETDHWEAANLIAFVLITTTGLFGFALERVLTYVPIRLPLLMITAAGSAIAAAHGAFGVLFRALQIVGMSEVDGAHFDVEKHGWVLWDLLVIEPWFLGEGILLGLIGFLAQRSDSSQLWWLKLVAGAFLIAFASAVFGLRVG